MTTADENNFHQRAGSFFLGLRQLEEKAIEEGFRFTMQEPKPDLRRLRPDEIVLSVLVAVTILKIAARSLESRAKEFAIEVQRPRL